jgi:hypothetical protein
VHFSTAAVKCLHSLILGLDKWYLEEIKAEYCDPEKKGYERVCIGDYNL